MNNNAEKQYELNKELAQMLKGGVIMDCLLYTSPSPRDSH